MIKNTKKTIINVIVIVSLAFILGIFVYINIAGQFLTTADHLFIETVTIENSVLRVRGSLSDSALLISQYKLVEDGDYAYLSIYQSFWEYGDAPTPYIDYSYYIPEHINKVYLKGSKGTLRELWNKEQGVLVTPISTGD